MNTETIGARPTVYIIDDVASTRRALERLLTASGFKTTAFDSAEAFLGAAANDDDACVLVDISHRASAVGAALGIVDTPRTRSVRTDHQGFC